MLNNLIRAYVAYLFLILLAGWILVKAFGLLVALAIFMVFLSVAVIPGAYSFIRLKINGKKIKDIGCPQCEDISRIEDLSLRFVMGDFFQMIIKPTILIWESWRDRKLICKTCGKTTLIRDLSGRLIEIDDDFYCLECVKLCICCKRPSFKKEFVAAEIWGGFVTDVICRRCQRSRKRNLNR